MVLLIVALSEVIARTPMRDGLINAIIAAPNLSASTERALPVKDSPRTFHESTREYFWSTVTSVLDHHQHRTAADNQLTPDGTREKWYGLD